ncbi:trehalose-phosphatase [bacterium]|nr:trehalose-phosphatase [bacterium]
MEHLLGSWPKGFCSSSHLLLFLDYDGTLTPIVDRPEAAVLKEEIRRLLHRLSQDERFTLGIISGRKLSEVKELVGIPKIIYAGNHGLQIEMAGEKFVPQGADEKRPVLAKLSEFLRKKGEKIRGFLLEDKGLSLTLHYREVQSEDIPKVKDIFKEAVKPFLGSIQVREGKCVLEVRPAIDWNKGKAVSWIIDKLKRPGLPVYLGDDLTDEDAFRVVNRIGGISVFVGLPTPDSLAAYYLSDPKEVERFLSGISARILGRA